VNQRVNGGAGFIATVQCCSTIANRNTKIPRAMFLNPFARRCSVVQVLVPVLDMRCAVLT
jgi:hypothetical protein